MYVCVCVCGGASSFLYLHIYQLRPQKGGSVPASLQLLLTLRNNLPFNVNRLSPEVTINRAQSQQLSYLDILIISR